MRTLLPDVRTLPSSTWATFSCFAISAIVDLLALEGERGGARDHAQLGYLRQQVQQLLRDAVGHVLLVLAGGHVGEGQHGDGFVVGRGSHF